MKKFKIMMQVLLAVFFFGLLATSTVLADTTGGQFVDKDNRKYYIKDDHKAIYWHKIDGKMYYFDDDGEMVVGWQYLEIPGTGYRDDLFDNRPVFEIGLQYKWYYFDQDGVLQEFVGWQQLEVKDSLTVGKKHGEGFEGPEVLKLANYYFSEDHSLKTGWLYDQSNWYYLAKTGHLGKDYLGGERRAGWINDGSTWYYLHANNGDMKTGWFQVNGKWYYAYSSGALAVSTRVDGYYVNYNGEWVQ